MKRFLIIAVVAILIVVLLRVFVLKQPEQSTPTMSSTPEWSMMFVLQGDTLGKIGSVFDRKVKDLAAENHIANPNILSANKPILVPFVTPESVWASLVCAVQGKSRFVDMTSQKPGTYYCREDDP